MATDSGFIEYVVEQLEGAGFLRTRKMFGEYAVYVNDRPVFLVCDDVVYVKMLDELKDILQDASTGYPYPGAREHYIVDIDDPDISRETAKIAAKILPIPKPKKKKKTDVKKVEL